jgi:phospholipase/lecithinase/hemolysin
MVQLATALTAAGGAYSGSDLLLIDGGGNDIADMIGAYLKGASDGGAAFAALLASNSVTATADPVASGNAYAVSLAKTFFASIKANAIDKGATHIAILNLPAVTKAPKIQEILDGVKKSVNDAAIAQGATAAAAATAAATKRAETEGLFLSWIAAFNTQLASSAADFSSVTTVVDFNTEMTAQVANPAQFGLTNATTPACPSTGIDSTNLKKYNFETCTAAALSANPPTGVTDPNWWKTYAFSDSFHPTPQGHKLMAQLVNRSLISKGWL